MQSEQTWHFSESEAIEDRSHTKSTAGPGSGSSAYSPPHSVNFKWMPMLCTAGVTVFIATLICIHLDRPLVRAPPGFYSTSFFAKPYLHLLSFHNDLHESSYVFLGSCTSFENVPLYLGQPPIRERTCRWPDPADPALQQHVGAGACLAPLLGPVPPRQSCSGIGLYSVNGEGTMSAKTVSMGIVQHPGYAILGYGFGMGCMLVCSTVLSIVLCSWWILVCAFTTYVAMLLVLGYAQIGGIPHFVAACVAIVGAAVTHLCILVVLQMRTGNGLGVYAVAVFIVFSSAALLACVALDDSLREEKRFALLEHLSIGFEVLTFVWTAFEKWVYIKCALQTQCSILDTGMDEDSVWNPPESRSYVYKLLCHAKPSAAYMRSHMGASFLAVFSLLKKAENGQNMQVIYAHFNEQLAAYAAWGRMIAGTNTAVESLVTTIGVDGSAVGFARLAALGPPDFISVEFDGALPYADPVTMRIVFDLQAGQIAQLRDALALGDTDSSDSETGSADSLLISG